MKLTAQERSDIEALRLKEDRERRERQACSVCGDRMKFVFTLDVGNDQGSGQAHLFQCPNCKTISVLDRAC
jgi:hypothetical protein